MKKLIVISFLLINSIFLQAENLREYEELVHSLRATPTSYLKNGQGELVDKSDEINARLEELNIKISRDPNNPILYLLKGLYYRAKVTIRNDIYLRKLRREGKITKEEANQDPERKRLIDKVTENYVKALELDSNQAHSLRLTKQMLYDITQDVVLDPAVNEAAIKREMALTKTAPTSTYYWDSYETMFQMYLGGKQYDEALRILDEMLDKFPGRTEIIQTAIANVELAKNTAEEKWKSTPAISKDDRASQKQVEPAEEKQVVDSKSVEPKKEEAQAEEPESKTQFLLIGIAVFCLLLVGFVLLFGRKIKR
ncbi:hypothetical protein [Pleionea sediminis]|uniref:hypothetical protein n=1 Tax=Pleionea sediminis TaxID=2569479 RepID=UPI0011846F58|nr:hypothetical protein [Pleionea sediminis]